MTRCWIGLEAIPGDVGPTAVTIGNFDGVHLGHRRILRLASETARANSLKAVAVTFDPHPLAVVAPGRAPESLTSVGRRVDLMVREGIAQVAVLPFTKELSRLSPLEFCERVLVGKLAARHVVVGRNFRFGRGQSGDAETLRDLGFRLGFGTSFAGTVLVGGEPVSSTRVRNLVRQGSVERARELLGREFCLQGPIVPGEGVGTRVTVPTLNLAPNSEVLPGDGVYITQTRLDGQGNFRGSVTNVGLRPTFGGRRRTVETYLLGTVEDTTPNAIELEFLRKIRDERRFPSAESLREQILADIKAAERYFQESGNPPATSSVEPTYDPGPAGRG